VLSSTVNSIHIQAANRRGNYFLYGQGLPLSRLDSSRLCLLPVVILKWVVFKLLKINKKSIKNLIGTVIAIAITENQSGATTAFSD
jgi:hypothetical protein